MASESDALESEKALIELFRRKGNGTGILRNMTDGGENPPNHTGRKQTAEEIAKRVAKLRGKKRSKEFCERMSLMTKGRLSWNKGIPHSDDHRRKLSVARANRPPHSQVTLAKMSAAHNNDAQKARLRQGSHIRWHQRRGLVNQECAFCKVGTNCPA